MIAPAKSIAEQVAAGPARDRQRLDEKRQFSRVLSRARGEPGGKAESRAAAEQLVSIALVQPVLAKMRESQNAAPPLAPNSAEKSFRQLHDAALAARIVGSQRWGLVAHVEQQMAKRAGGQNAAAPAAADPRTVNAFAPIAAGARETGPLR